MLALHWAFIGEPSLEGEVVILGLGAILSLSLSGCKVGQEVLSIYLSQCLW